MITLNELKGIIYDVGSDAKAECKYNGCNMASTIGELYDLATRRTKESFDAVYDFESVRRRAECSISTSEECMASAIKLRQGYIEHPEEDKCDMIEYYTKKIEWCMEDVESEKRMLSEETAYDARWEEIQENRSVEALYDLTVYAKNKIIFIHEEQECGILWTEFDITKCK